MEKGKVRVNDKCMWVASQSVLLVLHCTAHFFSSKDLDYNLLWDRALTWCMKCKLKRKGSYAPPPQIGWIESSVYREQRPNGKDLDTLQI